MWLTGLPASGKSTIAVALERQLVSAGQAAYLLDGDNIRHGLSDDLGFAPGDRAENVRRVGQVARLFADAGVVAVVSLVSPLRSDRIVPRQLHEAAGLPFIEVHVDTDVDECARRDPKGLYARARAGEIKGFTGVDAPYEPPEQARDPRRDRDDRRLPGRRPDPRGPAGARAMTDVRRSYLVCATQRSGSTLLCELLKDTGVAGRPEEYFEAMRDTGVPPHPTRLPAAASSPRG